MRRATYLIGIALALAGLAAPAATAHEHYLSDDGQFSIVLGEQNEPVYSYDWTNLDFIVHEDETNGTGGPVPGVNATVNATLISPGGEELEMPIEPQFGEKGRYEFVEDYFLTQPGQYEVRLTGHINGTDVSGTYKLPGPRTSMADQGFPTSPVPTLLGLNATVSDIAKSQQDSQALQKKVDDLQTRVDELENQVSSLETQLEEVETGSGTSQQSAPGLGAFAALGLIALAALVTGRRG